MDKGQIGDSRQLFVFVGLYVTEFDRHYRHNEDTEPHLQKSFAEGETPLAIKNNIILGR